MLDQALALQLRERAERLGDRPGLGAVKPADAKVDDVQRVEAEVAQIVVHGPAQLVRGECDEPVAVIVPARSDLGDDMEIVGVRVQGLLDELVRHMRAVIVAGVDVGDAQLDRLPQYGHRGATVGRGAEHVRAGQLHRAVPHAGDGQVRGHREGAAGKGARCHEDRLLEVCAARRARQPGFATALAPPVETRRRPAPGFA